jgi:hypothetical protein
MTATTGTDPTAPATTVPAAATRAAVTRASAVAPSVWPVATAAAWLALSAAIATWILTLATTPALASILIAAAPVIVGPLAFGLVTGRQGAASFGVGILLLVVLVGSTVETVPAGWVATLGLGGFATSSATFVSLVTRAESIDGRVLRSILGGLGALALVGVAGGALIVGLASELPERTLAVEAVAVLVLVTAIGLATAWLTGPDRTQDGGVEHRSGSSATSSGSR